MYSPLLFILLQIFITAGALQPELHIRQQSLSGDSKCGTLVCLAATVNGSTTTYILSTRGNERFGWMAIGFGRRMTDIPMVIMWKNSDGSATISQRSASGEVMPIVDPNPPRKAALSSELSDLSASRPTFAFTVPTNEDRIQPVIYAYGTTTPSSAAVDASIVQHLDYGLLSLDLTKQVSSSTAGSTPTSTPTEDSSLDVPLLPYQRLIIAHAIFCAFGFLLFLPAGVLLARFLRTFIPTWFQSHWIVQFAIAGPTTLIGIILGIVSISKARAKHMDDAHKRWGIAIFVLYLVQCALGAFIHFVKKQNRVRRPPQNYVHAVIGLAIMGLSLYQVHNGYDEEWPLTTGRDPVPSGVNIFFWVWAVLLAVAYGAGLSLLPKQYRQEHKTSQSVNRDVRNRFSLKQTTYQQSKR